MTTVTIHAVDFDDPQQTADFLFILDHYMRGPTGSGKPMDDELRAHLPDALRSRPTVLCHIAYVVMNHGKNAARRPDQLRRRFFHLRRQAAAQHPRHRGPRGFPPTRDRPRPPRPRRDGGAGTGCCKLTLEVLEGNRGAHRAYLEFGFQAYQTDPAMGAAMFMERNWAEPGGRRRPQKAIHSSSRRYSLPRSPCLKRP